MTFSLDKGSTLHLPLTQQIFLLSKFVWIDEEKERLDVEQDTFQRCRRKRRETSEGKHTAALSDKKRRLASFL